MNQIAKWSLALLAGCSVAHEAPHEPQWLPVECDHTDSIVWESEGEFGVRRTEITATVAIVDADGADVIVRVPGSPWPVHPCSERPVSGCAILAEDVLSPNVTYVYHGGWDGYVTGMEDGSARIVCSADVTTRTTPLSGDQERETYTTIMAEGGEYRVSR